MIRRVPSWSILDRSKPYVPSHLTDIRITFAKARAQQAQAKQKGKL